MANTTNQDITPQEERALNEIVAETFAASPAATSITEILNQCTGFLGVIAVCALFVLCPDEYSPGILALWGLGCSSNLALKAYLDHQITRGIKARMPEKTDLIKNGQIRSRLGAVIAVFIAAVTIYLTLQARG